MGRPLASIYRPVTMTRIGLLTSNSRQRLYYQYGDLLARFRDDINTGDRHIGYYLQSAEVIYTPARESILHQKHRRRKVTRLYLFLYFIDISFYFCFLWITSLYTVSLYKGYSFCMVMLALMLFITVLIVSFILIFDILVFWLFSFIFFDISIYFAYYFLYCITNAHFSIQYFT